MKLKKSAIDASVYMITCVVTLGIFWLFRILISVAIRHAIEDGQAPVAQGPG